MLRALASAGALRAPPRASSARRRRGRRGHGGLLLLPAAAAALAALLPAPARGAAAAAMGGGGGSVEQQYGRRGETDPEGFDPYADTVGPGIYGGRVKTDAEGNIFVGRQYQVRPMATRGRGVRGAGRGGAALHGRGRLGGHRGACALLRREVGTLGGRAARARAACRSKR